MPVIQLKCISMCIQQKRKHDFARAGNSANHVTVFEQQFVSNVEGSDGQANCV